MKQSYTWPAMQATASVLNVIGGMLNLSLNAENRNNPFFYTAILASSLYAAANINQICSIYKNNKDIEKKTTFVDLVHKCDKCVEIV